MANIFEGPATVTLETLRNYGGDAKKNVNLCLGILLRNSSNSFNLSWSNYPGADLVGTAFKFKKGKENSPLYGHVLHKRRIWPFRVLESLIERQTCVLS